MFTRRARGPEPEFESDLDRPPLLPGRMGVGAQVYVVDSDEDASTPWPSGPTGVILRAGGSAWQGVSAIGGSARTWWVEFDGEQVDRDGRGPFERAQVAERFLRLAPPLP